MSTWSHIHDAIVSFLTGKVWTFLKPFVTILESQGGQILIAAAENAVSVGFSTAGDGTAKMTAALASFSVDVAAKGVPFLENQARALIEAALLNAKATLPAPAPVA